MYMHLFPNKVRSIHHKEVNYRCLICGIGLYDKYELRRHCSVHHMRLHSGGELSVCSNCGHVEHLQRHCQRTHSGENQTDQSGSDSCSETNETEEDLPEPRAVVDPDQLRVECRHCGLFLNTKRDLRRHISRVHQRNTRYRCKCGLRFYHLPAYCTHKRICRRSSRRRRNRKNEQQFRLKKCRVCGSSCVNGVNGVGSGNDCRICNETSGCKWTLKVNGC